MIYVTESLTVVRNIEQRISVKDIGMYKTRNDYIRV